MSRPAILAAAALLAGCGSAEEPTATGRAPAASQSGPCDSARPARTVAAPKGLIMPSGALVESVTPQPPNERAEGFVAMTPSGFVAAFERETRLGILFKENEGRDAEMMVTDGKRRSFWKLRLACPEGSRFTVLTGEEMAPRAARRAIRRHAAAG